MWKKHLDKQTRNVQLNNVERGPGDVTCSTKFHYFRFPLETLKSSLLKIKIYRIHFQLHVKIDFIAD